MTLNTADRLTWIVVLAAVLAPGSVTASHADREKPIQQANLKITSANGAMKDTERLALTQTRRSQATLFVTGFELRGLLGVGKDQEAVSLRVISVLPERCGSLIYTAVSKPLRVPSPDAKQEFLSLRLLDHTTRFCKDRPEHRWNAVVRHLRVTATPTGPKTEKLGALAAGGNPAPVTSETGL